MATLKTLDPETAKYDTDGNGSDTDESFTDESADERIWPGKEPENPLLKRFRKPILFSSETVQKAAQGNLKNHLEYCAKILDYGLVLQLPDHIINIAAIYGLRFHMVCPNHIFTVPQIAASCVFLASKSEDAVRRLEAITSAYLRWENHGENKGLDVRKVTEMIKQIETYMLTVEGFQVNMRHPQRYLIQYDEKFDLSKKLLTTAQFVSTGIIHLTLLTLEHPMNYIAAAALHIASDWCSEQIGSKDARNPWYKAIESNKTLDLATLQAISKEFSYKWGQHPKYGQRLFDMKRKKLDGPMHKVPNDGTFDMNKGRYVDKRRDMKGSWSSMNSFADRRDNKYSGDKHNSWSVPRKPSDRMMNSSGAVRGSRPNSMSPNRHSSEERLANHASHGRFPHVNDRHVSEHTKVHISPSKIRVNDPQSYPSVNSFQGHKRSFDSGHDEHHQSSPMKQRKL